MYQEKKSNAREENLQKAFKLNQLNVFKHEKFGNV